MKPISLQQMRVAWRNGGKQYVYSDFTSIDILVAPLHKYEIRGVENLKKKENNDLGGNCVSWWIGTTVIWGLQLFSPIEQWLEFFQERTIQ